MRAVYSIPVLAFLVSSISAYAGNDGIDPPGSPAAKAPSLKCQAYFEGHLRDTNKLESTPWMIMGYVESASQCRALTISKLHFSSAPLGPNGARPSYEFARTSALAAKWVLDNGAFLGYFRSHGSVTSGDVERLEVELQCAQISGLSKAAIRARSRLGCDQL